MRKLRNALTIILSMFLALQMPAMAGELFERPLDNTLGKR